MLSILFKIVGMIWVNLRSWHLEWLLDFDDTTVSDGNVLLWLVTSISLGSLNFLHNIHSVDNFAKDNVLAVEPFGLDGGDEELRSVRVLASVGHREPAWAVVLELKVLVSKLGTIDASAASAIAIGKVTSLDHEIGNDTMKLGSLVALSLWLECELSKILNSLWHDFSKETNLNTANILIADTYVKVDLFGDDGLSFFGNTK